VTASIFPAFSLLCAWLLHACRHLTVLTLLCMSWAAMYLCAISRSGQLQCGMTGRALQHATSAAAAAGAGAATEQQKQLQSTSSSSSNSCQTADLAEQAEAAVAAGEHYRLTGDQSAEPTIDAAHAARPATLAGYSHYRLLLSELALRQCRTILAGACCAAPDLQHGIWRP
jgi:hypothetical protein